MSSVPLPLLREAPRRATLLVQLDCNARCPFCSTRVYTKEGILSPVDHREGVERRAKDYTLSFEELKGLYDRLRAEGVVEVSLQGGEPTLHPDLVRLVRYGREIGLPEQAIVTNGRTLKDRALVEALVEAGLTTLVVSIFGENAARHDASLGVRGAFDDLEAGVAELGRVTEAGARVAVMAQLTLHSGNVEALPAMLRHWRGRGLADFSVRLLRETENTRQEGSGRWFFDLERLREPLAEALSLCRSDAGLHLNLSELPYCLVGPDDVAFVLGDLGSNPALLAGKAQLSKHFALATGDARARAGEAFAACAGCDLEPVCVRPERPYLERFGGAFRPWRVGDEVRRLAREPARALELVDQDERLGLFGVTGDERLALRARAAHGATGERREVVLLGDVGRKELADRVRKHRGMPVGVRLVPASSVGLPGPLSAEAIATAGAHRTLEFLARAGVLAASPLVVLFAWRSRAAEGESLGVAALYEDRFVAPQLVEGCLAGIIDRAKSSAG